jgi:class 3 adenylate cyclase
MKRPIIFALAIGIVVAALVSVAHRLGWLWPAEAPLQNWMQRAEVPPTILSNVWQYVLVLPVSLAAACLTVITARRHRVAWLILAFVAEMLALVWVGSLYHIFFQPLPCILAAAVAYAGAVGYLAWDARPRLPKPMRKAPKPMHEAEPVPVAAPGLAAAVAPVPAPVIPPRIKPVPKTPAPKTILPKEPVQRELKQPVLKQPEPPRTEAPRPEETFAGAPDLFETTVLVCDLANKYDLVDNSDPATAAGNLAKFGQRASELLLKAGAHLHKADGEGVVALFGYPRALPEHAEKAVRAAFDLIHAFSSEAHSSNGDSASMGGAHVGVSSGAIIAGRGDGKSFVLGEAVELARRFCMANRFYGSRVLIGPQTFELASSAVVARPIDFLTGVTSQERHEIYEPLALAAEAPAELLARRDSFWNGVVLYREKRWVEALSEFQKARSGPEEDDPPLNLYLRRLEPLALQFLESGSE